MLHASFYAGCAFTKSYVGYVHAVAHSGWTVQRSPWTCQCHSAAAGTSGIWLLHWQKAPQTCQAGLADKNTPDHEAASFLSWAIEEMKERLGIVNIVKEIQETDILKLAHYADKVKSSVSCAENLWMPPNWRNFITCWCLPDFQGKYLRSWEVTVNILLSCKAFFIKISKYRNLQTLNSYLISIL